MNGEFDIGLAAYTPAPAEAYTDPIQYGMDWPAETRYATDYYSAQAAASSLNDANSSASGWLNSVANILPSVTNLVSAYLGTRKADSTPLPATVANTPQGTINGIAGQVRLPALLSGERQQAKTDNTLLFIIGGAILVFFLFMRK